MAGTVLFALEPALERIFVFYVPGVSGFASALYFALISMEVILVVLIWFEWRRHRVRLPFVMALGFFVAMHACLTPVANSPAFANFARWFARVLKQEDRRKSFVPMHLRRSPFAEVSEAKSESAPGDFHPLVIASRPEHNTAPLSVYERPVIQAVTRRTGFRDPWIGRA